MIIWQSILEALESLSTNKLRSGLTIIGIVIGVAAVIAIISIGRGAENSITGSIQGIGTNLLFVFRGGSDNVRNPQPMTLGDAAAIADPFQAPHVVGVVPELTGNVEVSAGGESRNVQIEGVTPEYSTVRNQKVSEGEFINQEHILGRASVVLLGTEVADNLFGRKDGLVGETVRVEGQPFRVIGVLESKGGSGFGSEDNRIMVPLTTAQTRLLRRATRDRVDLLVVQASSADAVAQATDEISQILRARHRTAIGADDFTILSQQDFLTTVQTITRRIHHLPGWYSRNFSAGGRDRDYEYHAGIGDRAHARDWIAQGFGRSSHRYHGPIPDRICLVEHVWWSDRHRPGCCNRIGGRQDRGSQGHSDHSSDRYRYDLIGDTIFHSGWSILRVCILPIARPGWNRWKRCATSRSAFWIIIPIDGFDQVALPAYNFLSAQEDD